MPGAGRLADLGSGHGCFPPSPTIAGSGDVFTNMRPALRKGDAILPHGCGQCPPHPRTVQKGSATVNINGWPAARIGDAISCGGDVMTGSGDVNIGDESYGSGTAETPKAVRFLVSQVPGSTAHGYFREPYKLFHNGGLVQEGLTDDDGVIVFEPDSVDGTFEIEAVQRRWKLTVQAFSPADTDAGSQDRLRALGYHTSDAVVTAPNDSKAEDITLSLGWFQNIRREPKDAATTDRIRNLLKAIIP